MRFTYNPEQAQQLFNELSKTTRENLEKSIADKSFNAKKQFLKYFNDTYVEAGRKSLSVTELKPAESSVTIFKFEIESNETKAELHDRIFYLYCFLKLYLRAEVDKSRLAKFEVYFGNIDKFTQSEITALIADLNELTGTDNNFKLKERTLTGKSSFSINAQGEIEDTDPINLQPYRHVNFANINFQVTDDNLFTGQFVLHKLMFKLQHIHPHREKVRFQDGEIVEINPRKNLEKIMVGLGELLVSKQIMDEVAFLILFDHLKDYYKLIIFIYPESQIADAIKFVIEDTYFTTYQNFLLNVMNNKVIVTNTNLLFSPRENQTNNNIENRDNDEKPNNKYS